MENIMPKKKVTISTEAFEQALVSLPEEHCASCLSF
jgi:hypothetical protein